MYDHYTGEVVGLKKITITETTHKALPAYNVHVQIDWKINNRQEILIAKLYPWLQLVNSTIQNLKDGIVQHFTSYESSDDGRIVASDGGADSTNHLPIFHIGKTEATRFLCEGNQLYSHHSNGEF